MRKAAKNKGVHISFWCTHEQAEKLDAMVAASGYSKTKVLKALIDSRPIPDKGYSRTYSQIASIGGLIKSQVKSGSYGNAYELGQEILKVARELERIEKERKICAPQSLQQK